MTVLFCSMPTLAISALYCLWHHHDERQRRRQRVLRQRVAYMLWVAAGRVS